MSLRPIKYLITFLVICFILTLSNSIFGEKDSKLYYNVEEQKSEIEEEVVDSEVKTPDESSDDEGASLRKEARKTKESEAVPGDRMGRKEKWGVGKKYIGFGNRIYIGEEKILYEDLSLVNSKIDVEGTLNGSLRMVFGEVRISGQVNGDLSIVGGELKLEDEAVVNGNIYFVGREFQKAPNAVVNGRIVSKKSYFLDLFEPVITFIFRGIPELKFFYSILMFLAKFGLILLIVYLTRKPIHRTRKAVKEAKLFSFILGLVFIFAGSGLMVASILSLVLSPLGLIIGICILIIIFWAYSILAKITGEVIIKIFKIKRSHWITEVLLGYIFITLINLIPTFGFIILLVFESFIIGGFLLTGFGKKHYVKKPILKGVEESEHN